MPTDTSRLIVECLIALQMTQKEMGALLGKNRRTIQRWQHTGTTLLEQDAETLAAALRPVRADLADRVLATMAKARREAGLDPEPASAKVVNAILRAAAAAGGTSADAVRPAVAAAFAKAEEIGTDLRAVAAAFK
jgi:hypothetical protein